MGTAATTMYTLLGHRVDITTPRVSVYRPKDLLREEAEALLGGIALDTKNFSMNTGVRTFEAATFLRSAGADTVSVKRLFQNDFDSVLERYRLVTAAESFLGNIMISASEKPARRFVAAQAADALLDVAGIGASFVIFPQNGEIVISARSLSDINVQMICEKLGGGGSQTAAGVQMKGITAAEARLRLEGAIESYFKENRIG
jgi:c-di-AMP phosphodiesterase-like protein